MHDNSVYDYDIYNIGLDDELTCKIRMRKKERKKEESVVYEEDGSDSCSAGKLKRKRETKHRNGL